MESDEALRRYVKAGEELGRQTEKLIGMCKLKLLDRESIVQQACVVAGCVSRDQACRKQLDEAQR